jgi:hypothetical protein
MDVHVRNMLADIESYDKNSLLNTSTGELAEYFAAKYTIDNVRLLEDEISADQKETKIDVTGDPNRYFSNPYEDHFIDGTEVTVSIPFEGDAGLFLRRASTFSMNPPRGNLDGQSVVLTFEVTNHDAAALKSQIERELTSIKAQLGYITQDLGDFKGHLRDRATGAINARSDKLKNDHSLVAGLGFKIHSRDDAPKTFVAPDVKLKLKPPVPSSSNPSELEPILAETDFKHILGIVKNMVHVIERSPKTFVGMDEEALRDHFLVQLNGHYEGQATGETFNAKGKTDILIRYKDKNIFIAECKFWKGAEVFREALKQLLGYATWRDGKLALVIFNRNKDTSQVLKQIPDLISESEYFVSFDSQTDETEFRFTLSHPSDKDRHMVLAVQLFDVPTD